MAASEMTQDLAALEQVRARLEATLADDENWRALRKSEGHDGSAESAARRARNTRLKMALADNPLYRAWKHVGEAIAALHESRARRDAAAGGLGDDVAAPSREVGAEFVTLGKFGSLARRLEVGRTGTVARDRRRGTEPTRPRELGKSLAVPPPARIEPPAASDPGATASTAPHRWAEPDEATVTFVRHDPLLPSVEQPEDHSTTPAEGLFARLNAVADEPQPVPRSPRGAFAAPGVAEEAEVVIVSSESVEARCEAEARAGTVRRLRKTLPGG